MVQKLRLHRFQDVLLRFFLLNNVHDLAHSFLTDLIWLNHRVSPHTDILYLEVVILV